MKKIGMLLLIIPIMMAFNVHKFYVSTTKVDYVEDKKALQIISKIFIEDIEDVLQQRFNSKIRVDTEKEGPEVEGLMRDYVMDRFHMKVDGKEIPLKYIGREYDMDMVKLYFEATNIRKFDAIEIENTVLFDLTEEQQNIVHVHAKKKRKSLVLDRENPNGLLNFN